MQNKIIAMIDPLQVEAVSDSLTALGIEGHTVSLVKLFGLQKDQALIFRMKKQSVHIQSEMVIEMTVDQSRTGDVLAAIRAVQKTGTIEPTKIEVQPVEEAHCI